jgi:hypothetical protein
MRVATLDRLDSYRVVRAWYYPEISQSPEVSEQHERTCNRLYGYIGALLQDLDSLERRNLRWRTEGLTARRHRLDVRPQKIEQQAREQGILLKPTNVQNVGSETIPKA